MEAALLKQQGYTPVIYILNLKRNQEHCYISHVQLKTFMPVPVSILNDGLQRGLLSAGKIVI